MTRKTFLFAIALAILLPFTTSAQQYGNGRRTHRQYEQREPLKPDSAFVAKFEPYSTFIKGQNFNYRVASIGNFDCEPPILVVYLHSQSASGNDNERQLAKSAVKKIYYYLKNKNINAYLFVPQCPDNRRWNERETNGWQMTSVVKLAMEEFAGQHTIDNNKVYIIGDSSGGAGVWRMLADYTDFFAAAMIAASYPSKGISEKNVAKTPLCYVLGSNDDVVSTEAMAPLVKSLQKKRCDLRYEQLEGKNHPETCRDAYTDENLSWVFGHFRK